MVLAVKVSSAAVLPSAEVGERTVSLVSGNPLLSGNPRPYLTTQYYHPWDKLIGLLTSHVILKMAGHALKSVLFRLVHSSLIFLYS